MVLADLKPLRKQHYPWGLPFSWLAAPDDDLRHVLRLCGGAAVQVQYLNDGMLKRTADLCKELSIPLLVQFSPWSKNLVPTGTPLEMYEEVRRFCQWCDAVVKTGVDVRAVSFDDERYDLFPTAEPMLPYRRMLYDAARSYFPKATIEWYGHGAVRPAATDTGWSEPAYQLGRDLPTDCLSTSLYRPGELEVQRMTVRKTVAAAGGKGVVVYLALGAGYKPEWDAFHKWTERWDYDLLNDRLFGRELNGIPWYSARPERYAPYDKVPYVVLYPPPAPGAWLEHFKAYVEGAQP